ncbi:MAG: hypothetical protein HRT87_11985 [Legionellales bacterium]|nr:hypothetical protein [Legionellales bacterium]
MKKILFITFTLLSLNIYSQDIEQHIKKSNELDYELFTTIVRKIDRLNNKVKILETQIEELKLDKKMLIELNNTQAKVLKELKQFDEYLDKVSKMKLDRIKERLKNKS